jgi:hypothetical protein
VFVAAYFNAGSGTTLTASGSGLSWAQDHFVSSGNLRIGVYSAPCPAGLAISSTLTATANGANHDMMGSAISILGVDTASPVVAFNGGTGATAAWTSSSIAALAGNAIVGGAFCDGLVGTSAASGSNTEFSDQNDATQNETQTGVYNLNTAASDSAAGTWSGAVTWVALGAAYRASTAVGGSNIVIPEFTFDEHGPGDFGPNAFYDGTVIETGAPVAAPGVTRRHRRMMKGAGL